MSRSGEPAVSAVRVLSGALPSPSHLMQAVLGLDAPTMA